MQLAQYQWVRTTAEQGHFWLPSKKLICCMQACTESSYHNFRKEQLSLRLEGRAFNEPKDASTHTVESHLVADSAHVESSASVNSADASQPENTEIVSRLVSLWTHRSSSCDQHAPLARVVQQNAQKF